MIWHLNDELWFPDPRTGEDDGLVAIGGDLSAQRLLLAYANGFFPWYAFSLTSKPRWYCPLDRYVIFPSEIHVSHTMRQLLRQQQYEVTIDEDFEGVIRGCSTAQGRYTECGAWLGPDIIRAYTRLHRMGYASSVEVWQPAAGTEGRRLVGGLYGVTRRRTTPPGTTSPPTADGARPALPHPIIAFFGESMFSLVPNASKLALIHLARAMEAAGGLFIDCQFETSLFRAMGGRHITYDDYMETLNGGALTPQV